MNQRDRIQRAQKAGLFLTYGAASGVSATRKALMGVFMLPQKVRSCGVSSTLHSHCYTFNALLCMAGHESRDFFKMRQSHRPPTGECQEGGQLTIKVRRVTRCPFFNRCCLACQRELRMPSSMKCNEVLQCTSLCRLVLPYNLNSMFMCCSVGTGFPHYRHEAKRWAKIRTEKCLSETQAFKTWAKATVTQHWVARESNICKVNI